MNIESSLGRFHSLCVDSLFDAANRVRGRYFLFSHCQESELSCNRVSEWSNQPFPLMSSRVAYGEQAKNSICEV